MDTLSLTKEARIYNGLKTISLTSGAGKTGQPLVKVLGASVRHSTHGKGHEEGGSTYAKAGSSLRSPPGNP